MKSYRNNHQLQWIYQQLQWIEIRTLRIIEGIQSHFGPIALPHPVIQLIADSFLDILDEREPEDFLRSLAFSIRKSEAEHISKHISLASPYKNLVEEQVLFDSRSTGQDAARKFLAQHDYPDDIQLQTLIIAIEKLCYLGMPSDRNHFSTVRPLSDFSMHFQKCPNSIAWIAGGGNPVFFDEIEQAWVRGILDILSPQITLERRYSIAKGHAFGLDHFQPQNS